MRRRHVVPGTTEFIVGQHDHHVRPLRTRPQCRDEIGNMRIAFRDRGIAGMLVTKGRLVPAVGAMPTHGMQFVALLIGTIIIIGGLTFLPALALGPVAEHFAMLQGTQYAAP